MFQYIDQARIYRGRTRCTPPGLFVLICKTNNLRPRFSLMIYTIAPPGSIFSGSAPVDAALSFGKKKDISDINLTFV